MRIVTMALLLTFVRVGAALAQDAVCTPDRAIFLGQDGDETSFSVEVADDAAERAKGLMFRENLAQKTGMLFVYETPQPVAFWMRNTLIPLDIVFMDQAGVVRHVHAGARPLDETPIPGARDGDPNPRRQFVLEIGGGEAARLGITPGDRMAHPAIDPRLASFPCR